MSPSYKFALHGEESVLELGEKKQLRYLNYFRHSSLKSPFVSLIFLNPLAIISSQDMFI